LAGFQVTINGRFWVTAEVEPFHLFRYLDEQSFRYNQRTDESGDAGRFETALSQILGKRLTYDELTGKAAMEKQRPC